MTKRLLIAGTALALAAASTASFAADTINGGFFVNGNLGQSDYRVAKSDGLDRSDTAAALRFGYTWYNTVDFGVEGGYVDLGRLKANYYSDFYEADTKLKVRGFLLGGNAKYRINRSNWYVSARGGWFDPRVDLSAQVYSSYGSGSASSSSHSSNGWYAGLGAGYDFAPNFSLGVNYDNYHVQSTFKPGNGLPNQKISGSVAMFSVSAEYRF